MKTLKELYKQTIRKATVPIAKYCLKLIDNRSWLPVFYFYISRQNIGAVQTLHILHKIQEQSGRPIVVISQWPFWPWSTSKDQFFTGFIRGLAPRISYFWIPVWLNALMQRLTFGIWRLLQVFDLLYRPIGPNSTIRFADLTTVDHTDILNDGDRVSLQIPKSHRGVLEKRLESLGISSGDWFVCVHAREDGYFKELNASETTNLPGYQHEFEHQRNVNIQDYFPAIDYIRSRGGKVVRMGDPSMTPVNGIDGFVDYALSGHQSMPMDLYIVSKCRFVLGCNSGFAFFPMVFNKPIIITNFDGPVYTMRWPYSNTLILPQPIREKATERVLSLPEMFRPAFFTITGAVDIGAMGYEWIPNTPEEILEATKELGGLIEDGSFDGPRTTEQEIFHRCRLDSLDKLWSPEENIGNIRFSNVRSSESRISASFASRHYASTARLVS